MMQWTWRDWAGVLGVAFVAAMVGAALIHVWTMPDSASLVLLRWRWSFGESIARILPTLIAMALVYWLSVLPYLRSRTRRSAILLTMFAGPSLALGVFAVGIGALLLVDPGEVVVHWEAMIYVFRWHGSLIHKIDWMMAFGILCAVFVFFVVAAAVLSIGRDKVETHPAEPQGGRRALLGILLMVTLSLPLWILMGWDRRRGSDRAGCIMNIRNVQQAMRSYQGMNGHNTGYLKSFSKETIVGPNSFVESEPVCPAGGTYWWAEGRIPAVGELMLHCSCPDHRPTDHRDW